MISMPVLYGVFLFMGVVSLNSLQLFERVLLFFMPEKYQPDHIYLRGVPLRRVHLYTIIQLACLICLWIIKEIKQTSMFFPLMLIIIVGVRALLGKAFSKNELQILDEDVPEFDKKEVDINHQKGNKSSLEIGAINVSLQDKDPKVADTIFCDHELTINEATEKEYKGLVSTNEENNNHSQIRLVTR
jgi:hypothetical protein